MTASSTVRVPGQDCKEDGPGGSWERHTGGTEHDLDFTLLPHHKRAVLVLSLAVLSSPGLSIPLTSEKNPAEKLRQVHVWDTVSTRTPKAVRRVRILDSDVIEELTSSQPAANPQINTVDVCLVVVGDVDLPVAPPGCTNTECVRSRLLPVAAPEAEHKKIRFRCDQSSTSLLSSALRDRGWAQVEEGDESWNVFWCDVTQVKTVLDSRRLEPHQKIPHFRNHFELTRKNLLARNLKRLKRLYQREGHTSEAELCDCMPLTFELPSEYLMFVEAYRRSSGATWIVKPACGSQGRGIFLFQRLRDLVEWRSKVRESAEKETLPFYQDAEQLHELYVVQRYVEQPYLLAGRKFDLRLYVLVTSYHPLKAWLSREGFARLSMAQFSLNEIDNSSVHLTNTTVQLRASSRAREKGCKWSLQRLREFLTARHGSKEVENLFQRVAQVVLTSLQSVQPVINQDRHCFELYGYDVLLDKTLRPWLLEVNASPSMGPTDRADRRLKYGIISDLFNVVDLEGRLTGRERRVGGFDLLWDGGPVWATSPGSEDCSGDGRAQIVEDTTRLNVFLGCNNDREEQLEQVWENARAFFNQQQCDHT